MADIGLFNVANGGVEKFFPLARGESGGIDPLASGGKEGRG